MGFWACGGFFVSSAFFVVCLFALIAKWSSTRPASDHSNAVIWLFFFFFFKLVTGNWVQHEVVTLKYVLFPNKKKCNLGFSLLQFSSLTFLSSSPRLCRLYTEVFIIQRKQSHTFLFIKDFYDQPYLAVSQPLSFYCFILQKEHYTRFVT